MTATPTRFDRPDRALQRDLRTLVRFIEVYCHDHHGPARQWPMVSLQTHDVERLAGHDLHLCPECRKLLQHALVKRSTCPMDPKPACKRCPRHCYAPVYRQQIRQVMRHSGRALVLRGRIDYLWHLLF